MNRSQQWELIRSQVAQIEQTDALRIIPHDNEGQLHLDVAAFNGRRYHLMLDLEDYDIEPPRLYVLDENGQVTWERAKLPPPPFLNLSMHPIDKRDFFCIPGTYDYHSHPLHQHEYWDALRNSTPLSALVRTLARTLKDPPKQEIKLRVKNLHKLPLKHVIIRLDNGEEARFDVEKGATLALRGLEIAVANNLVIRIEAEDAT